MLIFAAILFVLSFLIVTGLFLVKFGQVANRPLVRVRLAGVAVSHHEHLWPYFKKKLGSMMHLLWHFILEAKDLKPAASRSVQTQVQKVKSVFRVRIRSSEAEPQWLPEAAELTIRPTSRNPEELYLEAIKKNPNDHQAYEALGRLYLQNKNFTDAVEIYEYLTKLDPMRDAYFSNLGLSYYSLGEFAKAASAYEKAVSINGKVPTRWINLSLCFDALEDYTKAVKTLTSAMALDKMNTGYMMMLAEVYMKIPNNVRAEEMLEQILALEPTNKTAREKLMRLKI